MWNKVNGAVCVIAKYSAYLHICQLENVKGFLGALVCTAPPYRSLSRLKIHMKLFLELQMCRPYPSLERQKAVIAVNT
jgi:hypothetical protein